MPNFDAIIIGTGQSGPALGAAIGSCRPEGRDHRTQAVRRHLREHRLYSDQDANRERLRGTCCTSRRRLRHQDRGAGQCRHEGGEDAKGRCCQRLPEWRRAIIEDLARMHCLPRPRPLYREKESGGERFRARGRSDFHQCRRAPRFRRHPVSTKFRI